MMLSISTTYLQLLVNKIAYLHLDCTLRRQPNYKTSLGFLHILRKDKVVCLTCVVYFCWRAGRMRNLFATLPVFKVSSMFSRSILTSTLFKF